MIHFYQRHKGEGDVEQGGHGDNPPVDWVRCMNDYSKLGDLNLSILYTVQVCMSPQMEAILIWCQCRTRDYEVSSENKTHPWWDGE